MSHVPGGEVPPSLALSGLVPWEWLAGCRDCGRPHDYVPEPGGRSYMTWSSPGCASYRPRMNRWLLDALLVEYRSGEDPQ